MRPLAGYALLLALFAAAVVSAALEARAGFIVAGIAACGVHWALWQRVEGGTGGVLAGAVLLRLVAFPLPPRLSDDTYRYVWDGLVTRAGLNPYLHRPVDAAVEALQALPIFELLNSPEYFSVYPPLSQWIFLAGVWAGGGEWEASYYVTKALFVGLEGMGLLLLARLAAPRRLALYALHPLAALETAGQGHTEAALVLFLLVVAWAVRRGRAWSAGAAIAAAGWVKLYPFVLVPFVLRRAGLRGAVAAVLVTVVLVAPFAHPEAPGNVLSSLQLYVRVFEFNPGPYLVLREALALVLGYNPIRFLGPALAAVFFAALAWHAARTWRQPWPFERTGVWVLGAYLLTATTVHPWYLLGLLALLPLCPRPGAHWWWLAAASFATYLRYADGPLAGIGYTAAVLAGWGGAGVIAAVRYAPELLQPVLRRRGAAKADRIAQHLPARPGLRVLDLGAGEGWVGRRLADRLGADVTLADVLPPPAPGPAPALPYVRYDGRRLPFETGTFDVVVLYFVLHHAAAPEAVVREALRVGAERVVVVESVFRTQGERRRLAVLDRLVNRLRLDGQMREQEPHLHFRTADGWRELFEACGARVVDESERGRWVHRQHVFVLEPIRP